MTTFDTVDVQTTSEITEVEVPAEPSGPTFAQLGLPQQLVTALERRGIRHPFAIEATARPTPRAERAVLAKPARGSGKALALGLPWHAGVGETARRGARAPRALVLVPTRELAQQVFDS